MKKLLLIITIFSLTYTSSYASHLMGGDITYTHVTGNNYEVTLTLYRDCDGINLSTTSAGVSFQSVSCGQQFLENLPYIQTLDVSQVCPGQSTTCNGGFVPGTQQFIYRGIVTLTPCVDWIMYTSQNARNPAINNLINPGAQNLYLQNTLNNVVGAFNNSPQFFNVPTPYLCVNQLAIYSHAASDADGDSLYYQFHHPLTGTVPPGNQIPFVANPPPGNTYTLLQPMVTASGMNLDSLTGEMCFTPSIVNTAVVSVIVTEFRQGVLIGSQIRDMQVIVDATCTNQNPTVGTVATCGGSGGMTITVAGPSVDSLDQNSVRMCPNDSVCLQIVFSDPDPLQNIVVMDNIAAAIPGATWTLVNDSTPNPVGTFCWIPTALDSGINVFSLILEDDACPISGTQTFTYDITVFDEPYAGLDQIICGPQSAQLQASGGATYTWFDATTNIQVPVGPEFSCNPCINPIAMPSVTTDYYVLSSLTAACENTDTVRVIVVPDFVPDAIGDTVLCDFLTKQLDVNILSGPTGTYTYLWNNGATLSDDTIQNPIASPLAPTWYLVEVTSPDGCAKSIDSVFVDLVPPANVLLTPGDSTTICLGQSINFNIANIPISPIYTYNWSPNTGLSNDTIPNPVFIPTVADTIDFVATLTDTASGCSFDRTRTIIVINNTLNLPVLSDTSFCTGSSVTLDAGGPYLTYQWVPVGGSGQTTPVNNPGNYSVIVSDGICIDTSNIITVTEDLLPSPTILGDTTFCASDISTLLYIDPLYSNVSWSPSSSTTDSTTASAGVVTLTVDSSNGCSNSVSIIVASIPNPFTTIAGIDSICVGASTTLSATGGPFSSYSWSPSNSMTPTISAGPGAISVTVFNQEGCSYTANSIVYNYPTPVADFTINPEVSGEPNIDIVFTDASTGASSWIWNFDVTGINSSPLSETGPGPFTIVYDNQGDYTVSLDITNEFGCVNSISKQYLIFSEIGTPNIITPNGDGLNDILIFEGLNPLLFPNKLTVQNRWGGKVYEQSDYNNDWDGDDLNEGTYFYVLTVDFNTGQEIYKGTLSLLK